MGFIFCKLGYTATFLILSIVLFALWQVVGDE